MRHHRPVARQPVRPVVERGTQCAADQQARRAAAIEEQISLEHFAARQRHRFDEAVAGPQRNVAHQPFDVLDPARLGISAQVAREQRGVEMQRVGELVQRGAGRVDGPREAILQRGHRLHRIFLQPAGFAGEE